MRLKFVENLGFLPGKKKFKPEKKGNLYFLEKNSYRNSTYFGL